MIWFVLGILGLPIYLLVGIVVGGFYLYFTRHGSSDNDSQIGALLAVIFWPFLAVLLVLVSAWFLVLNLFELKPITWFSSLPIKVADKFEEWFDK